MFVSKTKNYQQKNYIVCVCLIERIIRTGCIEPDRLFELLKDLFLHVAVFFDFGSQFFLSPLESHARLDIIFINLYSLAKFKTFLKSYILGPDFW